MKMLAIDTSNYVMGIGIFENDTTIGQLVTNMPRNHSIRLMPGIDRLMEETETTPGELGKVAVAKGPGSYTGVRIGLSTAKSLAWALDIPISGISSLEVLAYQAGYYDGLVCTFFDARRDDVFTGLYQRDNWQMSHLKEESHIAMDTWLDELRALDREIIFLSPDMERFKDKIRDALGGKAIIPPGEFHIAQPDHLALAASFASPDDTHRLTPNYLRLAEAEAKWLKSQKGQVGR